METSLQLVGLACILAAIVGGGLEALAVKVRILHSVRRQLMLGAAGIVLLVLAPLTAAPGSGCFGNSAWPLGDWFLEEVLTAPSGRQFSANEFDRYITIQSLRNGDWYQGLGAFRPETQNYCGYIDAPLAIAPKFKFLDQVYGRPPYSLVLTFTNADVSSANPYIKAHPEVLM